MNDMYHKMKLDEYSRMKALEADITKDAVMSVFVSASEKGNLTAEQMYRHTDYYEAWVGGVDYITNQIRTDPTYKDGSYLFQCRNGHTSQEIYPPHLVPALWARIPRPDEGTHDNPIEYDASVGMELENGKFYTEDDVLYECFRDSGQPVYNRLADLVGIYVRVSNGGSV